MGIEVGDGQSTIEGVGKQHTGRKPGAIEVASRVVKGALHRWNVGFHRRAGAEYSVDPVSNEVIDPNDPRYAPKSRGNRPAATPDKVTVIPRPNPNAGMDLNPHRPDAPPSSDVLAEIGGKTDASPLIQVPDAPYDQKDRV